MINKKYLLPISFFLIVFFVFKSWFFPGLITGGDFWPYSKLIYETKPLFLYAWDLNNFGGLGGNVSALLWIYLNFGIGITIFGRFLNLNWVLVERIFYLYPFLILSVFSSYFLFSKLLNNKSFAVLSSAIFALNSYVLMVAGGGQIPGIGMAYSIFPLVIYCLIKANKSLIYSICLGVMLSVQIIFDLRVAYISIASVLIYWIIQIAENKSLKFSVNSFFNFFIIPGIISLLLNLFWIVPTILNGRNPVEDFGQAYSSINAVKFFSFAKFENTISLLHPNWPENIFGKVGFMKPEFLLLPVLAFSSLFFISKTKDQITKSYVLFFALLGLLGAFLAKGANEPFGGIYLWMFDHFPGFIMFRDPTKWYTLVALSYSVLIPFSVWKIYEWIKSRLQSKDKIFNFSYVFLIFTILYLIFLIRPALFGQLGGTFKTTQIPKDYIKFEKFLSSQKNFSRTLWIPTIQRFGYYSNSHPAIPAQNLFKTVDYSQILKNLRMPGTELLLQEASVKYVIVPYDSQGEIYLKDRKYDNKLYQQAVRGVSEIPWLKPVDCSIAKLLNCTGNPFGKIKVFEVHPPAGGPKDHFYISNQQSAISNQKLTYQYISPVEYKLEVKNAKKGDIVVFSESYDKNWIAKTPNYTLYAKRYGLFNSFVLPKDGSYSLRVYYTPQDYVNAGMAISGLTLVLILGALIYLRKKKI